MLVLVKCNACATSFRAAQQAAGKEMPCPQCGQTVKIEGPLVSPYDAFISYSSKDKPIADAVVAVLESKRIRCWVAPRDIVPGKEWSEAIIDGINQCRMMVLIFSDHANNSQQVLREVERAVHRAIPIVPFRIENQMPSKSMEYFISTHHWLDAYHPPLEQHLEKLAATTKALLDGAVAPTEAPKDFQGLMRAAVRTLLARDNRLRVMLGAAALLLVIGVLIIALIVGSMYAVQTPKASPELIQAKADATTLLEELRKIDRSQGFGAKIQEIDNELKAADGLFEQKHFPKALMAFQDILSKGPHLKDADKKRQEAKSAFRELEKSKQAAMDANAERFAPGLWAEAATKADDAQKSFEAGDFAGSRTRSQQAVKRFADARQVARMAGQARIKALAFWTGYGTGALQVRAAVAEKMRNVKTFDAPGIVRAINEWADSKTRIFWDTCVTELKLSNDIVQPLRDSSDAKALNSLLTKQLQDDLRKRYGREAEASYWLGRDLAIVDFSCTFSGASLALAEWAQHIHGTLDFGWAYAYTAGAPEVVTAALEQARANREQLVNETKRSAAGAFYRRLPEINAPLKELREQHLKDLHTATETFAKARAVPPLPAKQQEAVAEFAKLGAAFFFDPKPFRVVTIDFPKDQPGTQPIVGLLRELPDLENAYLNNQLVTDDDVAALKDLGKLSRLNLIGTKVSDAGLAHISKFTSLDSLILDGLPVSDNGLAHLTGMTKLRELSLQETPNVTPAGIDLLNKALPNLKIKR